MPRTNIINISSNESSPIQNNSIPITLDTTLALTITTTILSQTPPIQQIEASPLAPRELVFLTPPSSPFEPHPYLTFMEGFPPRSSNPPPSQGFAQRLHRPIPIDFEPFFSTINLSRRGSRMSAQPEPLLSREQVLQELSQHQALSHHLEATIQNAQNMQDSLLPSLSPLLHQYLHHSISPPPPQPLYYHLDLYSYHQIPLSLSIIRYG
nr:hypothetical protein [Tanacetum cinerariifolium]